MNFIDKTTSKSDRLISVKEYLLTFQNIQKIELVETNFKMHHH
jgi:hypothetical protein